MLKLYGILTRIAKLLNLHSSLDVFSVDANVFVLQVDTFPLLPKSTTLLRKKTERTSTEECFLKLGQKQASSLTEWYAFNETENTGIFAGKGMVSHFNALIQADDDILDAFVSFGLTEEVLEWIFGQME